MLVFGIIVACIMSAVSLVLWRHTLHQNHMLLSKLKKLIDYNRNLVYKITEDESTELPVLPAIDDSELRHVLGQHKHDTQIYRKESKSSS